MYSGDDPWETTGPPDRQTLRQIERQLTTDPLITETAYHPDSYTPSMLQCVFAIDRYPETVTEARVDVRWFTTGDFSFHYMEQHDDGDRWECRWDRHPNAHNQRLHFHQPPTAVECTDLSLASTHPLDVYSTVLSALEQRIKTLWNG